MAHCKECHKALSNAAYYVNREARLRQQREYYQCSKHAYAKKVQEYRSTAAGKRMMRKSQSNMRARYPDKYTCRNILSAALRDGKIVRPDRCTRCNRRGKIHGHHEDYSKPLDVQWLCHICHVDIHR